MHLPWKRKPKPDPDVAVRMAQAQLDRANFLAAEHERVTEKINERIRENHISQAFGAWVSHPVNHRRRMPWKAS